MAVRVLQETNIELFLSLNSGFKDESKVPSVDKTCKLRSPSNVGDGRKQGRDMVLYYRRKSCAVFNTMVFLCFCRVAETRGTLIPCDLQK